ncbi:type IV pilus assembly ATPase PilB [Thermus scotoductus]|uniref:ATP-binding protein n=1 Tax=Thermus scotoductus TaxID=37636 RepID=A0A430R5F2_THESC|nr:type IV pilus assembly ATPase PilB [Thermus scotoductus]RTG95478.1 ATP-binding protein [Thermus scotoductus]RTH02645.1 ATP-binding protein [Thermus scotoductus]RTH20573.1 ATP-binding protein [Thermus scotoductus]RTI00200.1 ATP-binding protein [Thermus scotoductus]RTI22343.1 ATP-binding protein [Thermus scotoductus]
MSVLTIGDKRLGAILLDAGLLTDEELQMALEKHREVGGSLAEVIVDSGLLSERRIAQAIEDHFGIPLVELHTLEIPPKVRALLPAEKAKELQAIPFAVDEEAGVVRVAFVNPLDTLALEEVEDLTGMVVEPYQATKSAFLYTLAKHYPELNLPLPPPPSGPSREELKVGELLVEKGLLDRNTLEEALVEQEKTGDLLGRILVRKGLSEEVLYQALSEQKGLEFLPSTEDLNPDPVATSLLLRSDALRYSAVPVAFRDGEVEVVLADSRHKEAVAELLGRPVRFLLTLPKEWEALFHQAYPENSRLGEVLVQEGRLSREDLREALEVQRRLPKAKPLGEILVELGLARPEDVEEALKKQRQGGGRLEDTLVASGKLKPEALAQAVAAQLGYAYINPEQTPPDPGAALLLPEDLCRRYGIFPHHVEGNRLVLLMKDPRNILALDDVRLALKRKGLAYEVVPAVATEAAITKLIERFYSREELGEIAKELSKGYQEEEAVTPELDESAAQKFVRQVIREAYLQDASDIHVEPRQSDVLVRLRIDGTLRQYTTLPKGALNPVISVIKIMGDLNIAEKRLPQDGRVRYRDGSIDLDLRLSTLPTVYGEKAVMRLLKKAADIPEIEGLGFAPGVFERFQEVISKPYGIFLITGPTGSGKSFTTFSILKRIATPDKNTQTIEDPVEYEIPGINQTQVNPQAGLTFARALRAFLRQDPDIIMVGEIRDSETAKIATEAALTGHLVIATLHTNDAAQAITRLDEMGVELFNISAALIGVLSQRLVRRICDHCKVEVKPDPEVLHRLGLSEKELQGAKLFRGMGCERCGGTGYKGRYAIHELLVVDDEIRHAIVAGKSATEIKEIARRKGMKTLREDGIYKAFQGITTLEEVLARTIE